MVKFSVGRTKDEPRWYSLVVENDDGGKVEFGLEATEEEAIRVWSYEAVVLAIAWSKPKQCKRCRGTGELSCTKCSGEGCSPYGIAANGPCTAGDKCPDCGGVKCSSPQK